MKSDGYEVNKENQLTTPHQAMEAALLRISRFNGNGL